MLPPVRDAHPGRRHRAARADGQVPETRGPAAAAAAGGGGVGSGRTQVLVRRQIDFLSAYTGGPIRPYFLNSNVSKII